MEVTYAQLVKQVTELCQEIKNKPEARYATRKAFYTLYGLVENGGAAYGRSELAFLEWEVNRGVLNPLDDPQQAGSEWWRNTNLNFIFYSELAGAMFAHKITHPDAPLCVHKWLDFLNEPSAQSWFIAHNSSILDGFNKYEGCTRLENKIEVEFINITLYRLLFAQAMVEGATLFPEIAEKIADPRSFGVELLVSLPDFYPDHYPLTPADIPIINGWVDTPEDHAVFLLDHIILANIHNLYIEAAKWNESPFTVDFLTKYTIPLTKIHVYKPTYGKNNQQPCLAEIGVTES